MMTRQTQRPVIISCLLLGLTLNSAYGQTFDLNVQNFRPAMDTRSLITVERSRPLGHLEPSIGLYMNYAWQPLKQSIGGVEETIVEHLVTGNFLLTLGLFDIIQIGGGLPVSVIRADGDGPGDGPLLAGDGIGDAHAHIKIRVLDSAAHPVGIALAATFDFPTGQADAFVSDAPGLVIRPKLILDWSVGQSVLMAINAGALLRPTKSLDEPVVLTNPENGMESQLARDEVITIGNAATYSFGLAWIITPERLDFVFETYGMVPLASEAALAMPLEVLAGLKLYLLGNSFFTFGVSRGLLNQFGDPDARGFAGIVFEPTVGDRDRDGLNDDDDQCPARPEDYDQFEDTDGCPDEDNDMDQIPDIIDQCRDIPEDRNNFEDEDGCPDGRRDRDKDGLPDVQDKCPDEPEDRDGFQDEDGCPDVDNDNDGIEDNRDKCPLLPEDIDGYQDDDGCPDPDNDGDNIPDVRDRCPDQAENVDGVDDDDGCPEAKVIVTRDKLEITDKVYFETGKATIKPESFELLNAVADTLKRFPQVLKVEVQGHTDSRGDDTYNLDLSQRRADSVSAYLSGQGVDEARLDARGYGETRPVDTAETKSAWSQNRRVEFIIKKHSGSKTSTSDEE